ncbi:unnamed protein product [Brassica rapa subsp. narinosa]
MNPTLQTACQQLAVDETPTTIPPPSAPVMDLDAALSEGNMTSWDIMLYNAYMNFPKSMMNSRRRSILLSPRQSSPKSLHNPILAQQMTPTENRFHSVHRESNPKHTTLSPDKTTTNLGKIQ